MERVGHTERISETGKTIRGIYRNQGRLARRNIIITAALSALLLCAGCDTGGNDPLSEPAKIPKTWHTVSLGNLNCLINKIAYGNGVFVAAGRNNGEPYISYSEDGALWWTGGIDLAPFGTDNMHVFFGGGWFIAHPSSAGNSHWAKSQDGEDWTAIGNASTWTGPGDHPYINSKGGAYGKGYWIVSGSGGRVSYSTDLVTWTLLPGTRTKCDSPSSGSANYLNGAAFGKGVFVVGGGSGHVAYTTAPDGTWNPTVKHANQSETTVNFTNPGDSGYWPNGGEIVETIFDRGFINGMVFSEEKGRFLAVGGRDGSGGQGKAAYSDDGIHWYQSGDLGPVGVGCSMAAVAYGGGIFLVGDTNGNAAYSKDGVSWTPIDGFLFDNGSNHRISTLSYGNGRWVAGGPGGFAAYSIPVLE